MGLPVPPAARGEGGKAVVPAAFQLKDMPKTDADLKGASLILKSGGAAGQVLSVAGVTGGLLTISYSQEAFATANSIKAGDRVDLDNSIYLAAQTYQRHQVPGSDGFYSFDQYLGADGKPLYPQRAVELGPRYTKNGTGCTMTGEISGKMIIVETLMDQYAIPYEADWYRKEVEKKLGSRTADSFRLWYIDNAMHGAPPPGPANARIVSYTNALQQALRDVSAWVEKGVAPPENSVYKIVDSQVVVPATAAERKGVQPVVTLTANGNPARVEVAVGEPVTLVGLVMVPPSTGKVVRAEWDFEGAGTYALPGQIKLDASGEKASVTTTYSFKKPGTYFPALRAASQRTPDNTPYAAIVNLGRVRVIVK